jgi:hypothetical protein
MWLYFLEMTRVYEEIVDFIAGGSTPDDVAAWTPSAEARENVAALVEKEKASTLSMDERGGAQSLP